MTALENLLDTYRKASVTEREKGTYFEELCITYLRNEASYKDLYSKIWTYADWTDEKGLADKKSDTGIDLVAQANGTGEYHAIQCKFHSDDTPILKKHIDSFFAASGKKDFSHRVIITSTDNWSENAEFMLENQQPPVTKINLLDLENSQIDWSKYQPKQAPAIKPKKQPREHQQQAITAVSKGFKTADRGKMIMACGTGKTFTSLKIAEQQAGRGKRVLFLVPSLSLLSQTLTEWTQESTTPLHSFAVCSDSDVGKKRKKDEDIVQTYTHELRYPATTEPKRLALEMARRHDTHHMSVVFSTYHSIQVISDAQHQHGLGEFELIVCDEAHRTTGATFDSDDESNFVKVHNADFIKATKRLYMTATPRIFSPMATAKAEQDKAVLYGMDKPEYYGHEFYVLTFSEAVYRKLLVDYKVIVLTINEAHVSRRLQALLADENNQLKVDDAAKIIGCWKALSKQGAEEDLTDDDNPMRRAVAFCQVIEPSTKAKTHKVSSKNIAAMFQEVVEAYQEQEKADGWIEDKAVFLTCEAEHVDGSMNAGQKEAKLNWLKAETPADTCRILSNVRCLSEGVDVPALDAVLFLTPRNSQVDVVQSVGRVMRNAPGKKRGYVILPVVIPAGVEPHVALNDNKTYAVVWQVLQALRSHDDRFDAMINKLEFIGSDKSKMEVIAVTEKVDRKAKKGEGTTNKQAGKGGQTIGTAETKPPVQEEFIYEVGDIERAIYAKVVQKCGNRHHWEDWANDIAKIANTHIDRIKGILENPANTKEREAFAGFAKELRDDLNDSLNDAEIIEMLAQHLVTKPVFDALFSGYNFTEHNPMSLAMQNVLNVLHEHHLEKETDTLQGFYASVAERAKGIDNAQGKQKIVVELYDKFFRNAFPRMTERLGIVYTPVEVVDFIIHSINDLLQSEFGQTLGSKNVHILDPFTGTGTFITRLLQSGLIGKDQLPHKYRHEIHANEIVLLAYYIAAINIEATYHSLIGDYQPFEGICLTDTFQLAEKEDLISQLLVDNSARRKRQKKLDIRVIMGNPPYSAGQESANDNNQNVAYPHLDNRIADTYAACSTATNKNALYNSYIRAIRWASDRIGNSGVIGFVSGSGFIEKPVMSCLRKCLADEFSHIHVINLRGDIRKNMLSKGRAKEGQNIFGSGSMTGIAITLFVKNPLSKRASEIYYHDIGNDLKADAKLGKIVEFHSVAGISTAQAWTPITPDAHGDWLSQRDDSFGEFISLGDKKDKNSVVVFESYSRGVATARDAWCYNASHAVLAKNMERMIEFYNAEVQRYQAACKGLSKESYPDIDSFIDFDSRKISWSVNPKQELAKGKQFTFEPNCLTASLYRLFTKQWLYYNRRFNERVYQMPRIFPDATVDNLVICVSGIGARSGFSALIADALPNLHTLDTGQCFPLYLYDTPEDQAKAAKSAAQTDDMFTSAAPAPHSRQRRDAITDAGLKHFQDAYPGEQINKQDLFYYIYGLLHSPDYREKYADNLSKELPRIPRVKSAADFWAFSKAGRALADLHLNYESVDMYPATLDGDAPGLDAAAYRVEKMKYGKKGKDKDLTTVIYNHRITIRDIPPQAYEYVVNGKPALDWVIERQCVKTDKTSGIVNDANDWAVETMNNPRYPLELLLRVITVSLETVDIVGKLPALKEKN
jgi:predicted helicase